MSPDTASITTLSTGVLVGFVLPLVVALLTRPSASESVKWSVHAVLAILAGAGVTISTQPDPTVVSGALVAVITHATSQANYHELWKNLSWFPRLQNALVSDPLHTEADDGSASKDL